VAPRDGVRLLCGQAQRDRSGKFAGPGRFVDARRFDLEWQAQPLQELLAVA
jgi:hypothetical protein